MEMLNVLAHPVAWNQNYKIFKMVYLTTQPPPLFLYFQKTSPTPTLLNSLGT